MKKAKNIYLQDDKIIFDFDDGDFYLMDNVKRIRKLRDDYSINPEHENIEYRINAENYEYRR
jgi:hypothetical protein